MKSKLTYLVLFSVVGLAAAAAAETAGVTLNSGVAYALPFSVFVVSLIFMILGTDYSRSYQALTVEHNRPTMLPAEEAFGASQMISRRPAIARRRVRLSALVSR